MVRRAVVIAAASGYLRIGVRFASIALLARLLTPAEIGIAVIGSGIMTVMLGLREFASPEFLIQRHQVTRDDIRASFTVLFLMTALMTVAAFLVAPWIGELYGEPKLAPFLQISAIAGLIEALSLPILGLLRRDMAFGAIACINTTNAAALALATSGFALAGHGFMSYAWGAAGAGGATTIMAFLFRPDLSILRPALRSWSKVLTFGGYNGASAVINRIYEGLPQIFLGQVLSHSQIGMYDRANVASEVPDKIVLTSVFTVAFPALAGRVREGRCVKEPYLRALGLIAAVYWPAQILLAILAYPAVWIILGPQWLDDGVPVLQFLALAGLAWFPVYMAPPVLLALGANRDRLLVDLIGRPVAAIGLCGAAFFGILAMAASKLVTMPFHMMLAFWLIRRHVPFQWRELGAALGGSAVVTAGTALGPLVVVALSERGFALSFAQTVLALALAAAGWLAAVLLAQHPILLELRRAFDEFAELPVLGRLRELFSRRARGPGRSGSRPARPALRLQLQAATSRKSGQLRSLSEITLTGSGQSIPKAGSS